MPEDIEPEDVEDEVLKVMKAANVKVDGKHVRKIDIQAAHYKRNKSVIVKFVNRKFAETAIANGNLLKDKRLFDNDKNIYVNNSFCREFAFINFAIRQAKKKSEICLYKLKHGVNYVQMRVNGRLEQIAHVNDLIKLGITVPPRRY